MSIALLHGFTGSSQAWGATILDGLASIGGAPVLIDLPGHGGHAGDADPSHFTLDAVFAAIDDAGRGEPVDLVGYSMGGRMALAYSVTHPERVRRLVLESASPGLADAGDRARRREDDERLAARIEEDGLDAFVAHWESLPLFGGHARLPVDIREAVRARRLLNHPDSLAMSLRALGTGSQPSYWGGLPGLDLPVLVLVGAEDRKFLEVGRRMTAALPDGRLEVVEGSGHTVHLERPDAWLTAVAGFLAG